MLRPLLQDKITSHSVMTHPADALAGSVYEIGSVVIPDGDFETYSEAGYIWDDERNKWGALPGASMGPNRYGLGCVGAASYTEHPSAEVLSFYYNLKDGAGRIFWRPGLPNPQPLFDHIARGGIFEAWNVAFERWVWLNICHTKYGWPAPPPVWQLRCAMGKARAYALPGKLAKAGEVLRVVAAKDKEGVRLLDKFSKPRNPTKKDTRRRITPAEDHADAVALYRYNEIDIISEAEVSALVPDLEGEELEFWQCDFAMNARGVQIDTAMIQNCIAIIEQADAKYNSELAAITGGIRASELAKLKGWLAGRGTYTDSMDEEALDNASKWPLPPDVRRVIEIRQAIGSASVKKLYSMMNQATRGGRLHDLFSYHAARTGRVTGNGPQPTNLPKEGPPVYRCLCKRHYALKLPACPWCGFPKAPGAIAAEWTVDAAQDALEVIATRSLAAVEFYFVDALATIAGCLRALFVAAPDHDIVGCDYSSIEAVVIAMIAGESWREDVFRTHGKIYEMGASKITGIPFQEYLDYRKRTGSHHPTRQGLGKISELASGYGGWIGAWRRFIDKENIGKPEDKKIKLTDDEIKAGILSWRKASPCIPWLWGGQYIETHAGLLPQRYGCEGMALNAMFAPDTRFEVLRENGTETGVSFLYDSKRDVLRCRIPSGRDMIYHRPRVEKSDRYKTDWTISYEGWNSNAMKGPIGWVRMYIYGGAWVENICQAAARDVLRFAIINLEKAGWAVVMQVYDEIIAEIRKGWGALADFERIMGTLPEWCKNWPIKALGGWRGFRYRKG